MVICRLSIIGMRGGSRLLVSAGEGWYVGIGVLYVREDLGHWEEQASKLHLSHLLLKLALMIFGERYKEDTTLLSTT